MYRRPLFTMTALFIMSSALTIVSTPADPSSYGEELGKYVSEGSVDYEEWSRDRDGLDSYIASLGSVDLEDMPEKERKTLFINAYNAFMIWLILEHYPIESVNEIKPKVFEQKSLDLGSVKVSLDRIEHEYLRPMGDPRIHFAIVCGSKGCPDLSSELYRPESLDEQLDEAGRRYLSQPKGLVVENVDTDRPVVKLSKIVEWFGGDFGETRALQLRALAVYAPPEYQNILRRKADTARIEYIEYDWSLNGT